MNSLMHALLAGDLRKSYFLFQRLPFHTNLQNFIQVGQLLQTNRAATWAILGKKL